MKKILIGVLMIILIVFVGVYFKVRYANNPLAIYQDAFTLSSDKTNSDILDRAVKMRYSSIAYQAKKLKQESGSYVGFCKSPDVVGGSGISKIDNLFCNDSSNAYVLSGSITRGNYLCVDDSDIVRKLSASLSVDATKCPVTAPVVQ